MMLAVAPSILAVATTSGRRTVAAGAISTSVIEKNLPAATALAQQAGFWDEMKPPRRRNDQIKMFTAASGDVCRLNNGTNKIHNFISYFVVWARHEILNAIGTPPTTEDGWWARATRATLLKKHNVSFQANNCLQSSWWRPTIPIQWSLIELNAGRKAREKTKKKKK